jgi:uncharacterized membrane protein
MTKPTDKELDCSTAKMLKAGVTLAAAVVFAGGLLLLRHPFTQIPDYSHYHAVEPSLRSVTGVASAAFHLDPRGLVQLGLMLLIATPVARVVFCLYGFIRQRDKLYTVISSLVLIILLYSLSKGAH